MRLAGLTVAISWGIAGATLGIKQQRVGLEPEAIDCGYRVQLLRDRVVALIDSSPAALRIGVDDERVSTLIRETKAACAAQDERLARELDNLAISASEFQDRVRRNAEARHDLLAL